jgi:Domain of unknown function (DUF397)
MNSIRICQPQVLTPYARADADCYRQLHLPLSDPRKVIKMANDRIVVPAQQLDGAQWHKSTFSGQHACVEVAILDGGEVAVRHSRQPAGPALVFTPEEWSAFLQGAWHGEFGERPAH